MNIFSIHQNIVASYKDYLRSFINIKDKRIKDKVDEALAAGILLPDVLLQFNPSFKRGKSILELCSEGRLHPTIQDIFRGYELFTHQVEAVELGVQGKDFIVTSGTGSGKSLTYIATIFNHVLNRKASKKGITAIIVYPMNALINSQSEEFNKFKKNYEAQGLGEFPISYQQYTGQEGQDVRDKIKENPPDILLTNYMMLELIMTRSGEQSIREQMQAALEFLVFDELHTYRGRQGADVGMLIRRIRSFASNPVACIGTSATMVSGDSLDEQRLAISEVAGKIFGKDFESNQIINETLERQTNHAGRLPSMFELQEALSRHIDTEASEETLKDNPLAIWLENKIALEEINGWVRRRKPMTRKEIADELAKDSGESTSRCETQIKMLLDWAENINKDLRQRKIRRSYFPYKLHQFISQTGSVYVTLEPIHTRAITLDPGYYIKQDHQQKLIYPVVFSRISGHEFMCVRKNSKDSKLLPRDFNDTYSADEEENENVGYLILPHGDEEIWSPEDIQLLPDSWLRETKKDGLKIISKYAGKIPQKIYLATDGQFSEQPDAAFPMLGWYMPAKLLFDPTSGTFYDEKTNEGTKLMRLGNEGRSTATTILSYSVIKELHHSRLPIAEQKLLSFTDNRQDAALQSGHFNDFVKVGQLRSALYFALKNAPDNQLDYATLSNAIFQALNLGQEDFAQTPSQFPGKKIENDNALKEYIMVRALHDLRRGWRVVLPNLEQCGLLRIEYKYLRELCSEESYWSKIPFLNEIAPEERYEIMEDVLDYFRTSYALHSSDLKSGRLYEIQKRIREKLKDPWSLGPNEKIDDPNFLRYEPIGKAVNLFTASAGITSNLGKYFKFITKNYPGIVLNQDGYVSFVSALFDLLADAGFLHKETVKVEGRRELDLFQLRVDSIAWKLGDGKTVKPDNVRTRTYKERQEKKPNEFFRRFYMQDFSQLKPIIGSEHTGQVSNEDRIIREDKFKLGEISTLFCSPTMELGIDIANLNVVHMRNAPPNPSNYAQRSGRAGRSGQAALVITYCSNFSPHDRHYFKKNRDMVAGAVVPPQIELRNEELLVTHINALYMAALGLHDLNTSIANLVEVTHLPDLPLKDEVKEKLKDGHAKRVQTVLHSFLNAIEDTKSILAKSGYTEDWIRMSIEQVPQKLDKALERWRIMYRNAVRQRNEAQEILNNPIYGPGSLERTNAKRLQSQSIRQLDLLANQETKGKSTQFSEFYPYRYLASEGFLPGYNFTRLPSRVFLGMGDEGEYLSRPRFLAISEFGPRNVLYHNGTKYLMKRMLVSEADNQLVEAKASRYSGYLLMNDEYDNELCPITHQPLTTDDNREIFKNILKLEEMNGEPQERISCEEEERMRTGFEIQTYFSMPGGMSRSEEILIKSGDDLLLRIFFMPAAKLYKINKKWKRAVQPEGFAMGMQSGFWKRQKDAEEQERQIEPIKFIKLITDGNADALYIQPVKALGITEAGVISLQYALKRAIEMVFQAESNEIGSETLGDVDIPNILVYEASQGSLGILSKFARDKDQLMEVFKKAYEICYFKDGEDTRPELPAATYDDLLSYYNQTHHDILDRFSIKDILEKLMACSIEIKPRAQDEYEDQYLKLQKQIDPNADTEAAFLKHLHKNGLRLPDAAQPKMSETDGLFIQPDFLYGSRILLFCDGTPHDKPHVQQDDTAKRRALRDAGYRVLTWNYSEPLEQFVAKYPDVFTKVK